MRIVALILLSLLSLPVLAQQKAPPHTCRVLFLARPADAPKSLFLFDGASSQEVELGSMSFSPVYQLRPGDLHLVLLREPPQPVPAGEAPVILPGAPNASVGEAVVDFYLIVSSDPSNAVAPVRMQVINADASRFKKGQMLWYNLTDSQVGGVLGASKLRLQPNSREILDPPVSAAEDYAVNIHYLPPGKQRAEPLCETRWNHDPRSRSVFFVLREPGRAVPRIIGIPDYRE